MRYQTIRRPRPCQLPGRIAFAALCLLWAWPAAAQFQMPDPKQMSGIPRPVTDLPDGTVSVRLIRGDFSHNITDFPVQMHVGGKVRTVKTDESGRAEFGNLPAGETLRVTAVVGGERLESEEFQAPAQGGIRLMLVATDASKRASTEPQAPPVAGQVILGNQSRIIVEPGDGAVSVYYVLDIVNNARVPVTPAAAFTFDVPAGAGRTSLLEGSSPTASVTGPTVTVSGPFAPGHTPVQLAYELPIGSASLQLTQRFPVALEHLAVVVKKLGDMKLVSPQLGSQQDMTASGEVFVAATGGAVAAGQPIDLTLNNLPHHSPVPRWIALSLAAAIIVCGVWMSGRREGTEALTAERNRLVGRRDKLFNELVRLEHDRRASKIAPSRYEVRREELLAALEHIYGALDSDDMDPGPDRSGLAA